MGIFKYIPILMLVACVLLCGCTTTTPEQPETATPTEEITPVATPEEDQTVSIPEGEVPMETPETGTEEASLTFAEKMKIIQERLDSQPPIEMKMGTTTDIYLEENPTTGYMWNATVTSGLAIINDTYIAPEEMRPGAGGEHHWTIEGTDVGEQVFSAVYKRSWEESSPDDATYTEKFLVTE